MIKKKIVHIIPTFELGGVQTGILYSLEKLNNVYDYRVLVIGKIDMEWLDSMPFVSREYIITTGARILAAGWRKGYRILKKLQPDLIISSLWKSVGLSATYRLLHKKVILCGFFHSASSPHLSATFFMKMMSFIQDTSLADSYATQQFLERFYKINNSHIIPYVFTFAPKNGHENFNPSQIRLAYFGRISQRKGVDRSIEFCRLLSQSGVNFIFDIYGDGPMDIYREKIRKFGLINVAQLKEILPLHEVMDKMGQYDFLLQLSNHEGMALAVVEAMNCGLVPIVTPVGEIKRYSRDGINAIWLDEVYDDNLPALVEKVKKVSANPILYHEISANAAGTFINYRKYTTVLIEVIDSYINNNKSRHQLETNQP